MLIQIRSSLLRIEELNATAAKHVEEPIRKCAEAGIPPLENKLKSYLEGLELRTIGRTLGVHHKTLSHWLVQVAG